MRVNHRTGEEEVGGQVIGAIKHYYTAWAKSDARRLGSFWAEDDYEAKKMVQMSWPEEFRRGIELRCYE